MTAFGVIEALQTLQETLEHQDARIDELRKQRDAARQERDRLQAQQTNTPGRDLANCRSDLEKCHKRIEELERHMIDGVDAKRATAAEKDHIVTQRKLRLQVDLTHSLEGRLKRAREDARDAIIARDEANKVVHDQRVRIEAQKEQIDHLQKTVADLTAPVDMSAVAVRDREIRQLRNDNARMYCTARDLERRLDAIRNAMQS